MKEYIKLLELPDEFDLAILKRAYRKKVLKYHPDKAANEAERIGFEALMKKLNEANERLKEYLENHGGKYIKPSENNTYYSNEAQEAEPESENENETEQDEAYENEEEINEQAEESEEAEDKNEEESTINDESDFPEPIPPELDLRGLSTTEMISRINHITNSPKLMFKLLAYYWKKFKWQFAKNPVATVVSIIIVVILGYFLFGFLDKATSPNVDPQSTQEQQVANPNEQATEKTQPANLNSTTTPSDLEKDLNNYMNETFKKVTANLGIQPQTITRPIKDVIGVTISKEGYLINEPIVKTPSGEYGYDEECIKAIKLAAPFKPLPESVKGNSLSIDFTFEMAPKTRSNLE